jgi:hypothetical protein
MVNLKSGNGQVALEPSCPVHGRMSLDFARDSWVCHGWDGEGCDHVVRMEDMEWFLVSDMTMTWSLNG